MIKFYKNSIYIIMMMLLFFVGVVLPFHYALLLLIVITYMFILNKWIKVKSLGPLKMIIVSLLMQNTFIGIGMHWFGVEGKSITLYTQVPTIFIFITGMWILIIQINDKYNYLFYLYGVVILFNYIISSNKSLTSFAYNTRNFTVFYMAFVIGAYFIDNKNKFNELCRFIIRISVFAGFVGIIGYFTDSKLYIWLGAAEVANVKRLNSGTNIMINGLPGYFYGDFFGKYYNRLASLFLEPVNFSSFIALSVVLKMTDLKNEKDWIVLTFLLICNFMTFGKGGLLIDAVSFIALAAYNIFFKGMKIARKSMFQIVKWGLIFVVIILGSIYGTIYSYNMHFYSIKITMKALIQHPFGFGVGSVGNVNKSVIQNASYLGAETGVLNFWCQLGIEGIFIFMALIFRMSRDGFKMLIDERHFVFALMPIILFLVFIFQENIFTTQVITGYMFVIGYVSNAGRNYRLEMNRRKQ